MNISPKLVDKKKYLTLGQKLLLAIGNRCKQIIKKGYSDKNALAYNSRSHTAY